MNTKGYSFYHWSFLIIQHGNFFPVTQSVELSKRKGIYWSKCTLNQIIFLFCHSFNIWHLVFYLAILSVTKFSLSFYWRIFHFHSYSSNPSILTASSLYQALFISCLYHYNNFQTVFLSTIFSPLHIAARIAFYHATFQIKNINGSLRSR